MFLIFISLIIMIIIETLLKIFNKSISNNFSKMKIIRAVELAVLSPFIVSGLLIMRGKNINESLNIVVGISAIIIMLAIRIIMIQLKKNDLQ